MMRANPDLEALYRRAIADPESITRAERNAIWGWPPPEEEDRLCVARTGHTRAELKAKALSNPDDLTLLEAKILCRLDGVQVRMNPSREEQLEYQAYSYRRAKNPSPTEVLCDEAQRALMKLDGEDDRTARLNAVRREFAPRAARLDGLRRQWQEVNRANRLKTGTPWMKAMIQDGLLEGGAECWGFVVFRTGCYGSEEGEAAWQKFRQHFEKVAQTSVLHWNSGPQLWPTFRAVFVEDGEGLDGASDEQLRSRFKTMRDGEGGDHLPKGMRTNCFLVADRAVIESEAVQTPYVPRYTDDIESTVRILPEDPVVYIRAIDPDYVVPVQGAMKKEETWGDDEEMRDFKGEATVALPPVFTWLHYVCFSAENGACTSGPKLRIGWHDIHVQTRTPEAWTRNFAPYSGGISYC